jgi:hypothetical protein
MIDANKQCDAQGYIADESFLDKMDTGIVPVSHIHTVDVSVKYRCACRTFRIDYTETKNGLKGAEVSVKTSLQNKNKKQLHCSYVSSIRLTSSIH